MYKADIWHGIRYIFILEWSVMDVVKREMLERKRDQQ